MRSPVQGMFIQSVVLNILNTSVRGERKSEYAEKILGR